jgi:hypothetical protein
MLIFLLKKRSDLLIQTLDSNYQTGTKKEATLAGRLFQFDLKTKISFYPRITS